MSRQPRDWLVPPGAFGRSRTTSWVRPGPGEEPDLRAAMWLHRFSAEVSLRLARRAGDNSQQALATESGIPYQRLNKGLRGQVAFTVRDVQALAMVFPGLTGDLDVRLPGNPERTGTGGGPMSPGQPVG